MSRPISRIYTLFSPKGEEFSPEEKAQIQTHRLLCALGAVLVLFLDLLYSSTSPGSFQQMGPRLLIAAFFAGLLVASYLSRRVRKRYVVLMRGGVYVLLGWIMALTVVTQFQGGFAIGLLLTYAVLTPTVGLRPRR